MAHKHSTHDHGQQHHHHPAPTFNRAFLVGISLNMAFVLVEAFYGWRINSLALLADAGHNLSDVAGLLVAWGGLLAGGLLPNARHSYGWKRASILAAFANALLLLVAMGSLIWEAIGRIDTDAIPDGYTIMLVAGVGVVINSVTALLFMHDTQDLNIRGAFLHMVADALVSVGVVVSGALALWFGWSWIDPVVSLLIAVVIVWGTWSLFHHSLHLLFDGVPQNVSLPEVQSYLQSLSGVTQVHDLHIWALGTSEVALTVHLVMPDGYPGDEFQNKLAVELRTHFGIHHPTIQIEMRAAECGCPQGF